MDDKKKTIAIHFHINHGCSMSCLSCDAIDMDDLEHFCVISTKEWVFDWPFHFKVSKGEFYHNTHPSMGVIAEELYSWYVGMKERYLRVYFFSCDATSTWPILSNFVLYHVKDSRHWPSDAKCSMEVYHTFASICGTRQVENVILRSRSMPLWGHQPVGGYDYVPHSDSIVTEAYGWWDMNRKIKKFGRLFKELVLEFDEVEQIPS